MTPLLRRLLPGLLCLGLLPLSLPAQRTYSFGVGGGTAYYYGDLTDQFNPRLFRPGATLAASAYLMPTLSLRVSFTQGWVGAADSLASAAPRQQRNLHFRSPITEGSAVLVWELIRDRRFGRRFLKKPHLSPYLFGGVAIYRFNPRARYQDTWYALQPLGTEGQHAGVADAPLPYSLTQMSLPFGFGAEMRFRPSVGVRAELGYRHTFTDYLDDVSTNYPEPEALAATGIPMAKELSNRSNGVFAAGTKRGNPSAKDSYFFLTASLVYYLSPFQGR